ncbi:MAG TPA: hypothetical protein VHK88_12685, partial [Aquihabitans sp.]|nr:hypothetical protein [Aquihabitans sp.]
HRAARAVGARLVFVVHDHQHHTRTSGTHLGLRRQVRRADVLLAHSRFVADRVAARFGRRPALMPQPVPVAMVRLPAPSTPVLPEPEGRRALHFGVLSRRSTKGTDIAVAVAEGGVPGWEFAFLGVQAPDVPGARSVDRFLDADEMVDAVRSSTASLLPYRMASQSGAVVLAQALGSVPIACRVGGLGEQIDHGRTGLLLEPSATPARWARSLQDLDDGGAAELAAAAHRSVWAQHERFAVEAARVVAP